MSKVHTFPTVTELLPGFRIPFQYIGTGETPAAKAIPDDVLLAWITENTNMAPVPVTVSTGGTMTIMGGHLIQCIAVEADTPARTIKIGTSSGADDVLELTSIPTNSDFTLTLNRYISSNLTLHFTITGGTCSVIVFKTQKG